MIIYSTRNDYRHIYSTRNGYRHIYSTRNGYRHIYSTRNGYRHIFSTRNGYRHIFPLEMVIGTSIPLEIVIGTSIPLEMVIGTSIPLEMVIGTSVVTKKRLIQIQYQMGFKSLWVPIWRSLVISLHSPSSMHCMYTTVNSGQISNSYHIERSRSLWCNKNKKVTVNVV